MINHNINDLVNMIDEASMDRNRVAMSMTLNDEAGNIINQLCARFFGFGAGYINYEEGKGTFSITNVPNLVITLQQQDKGTLINVDTIPVIPVDGLHIFRSSNVFDINSGIITVPLFMLKQLSFIENKEPFYINALGVNDKNNGILFDCVNLEMSDYINLVKRYKAVSI